MGLNMTLEQAQAQSASVISVCQAQVQGYQALQQAIQTFAEDTENLQGKAYDSARNYYQLVLLPLAQGGQLYAETLKKAGADFPTGYEEKVDTKSWSEEQLQEYIRKEEEMIAKLNDYAKSLARSSMPSELKHQLEINNTELLRGHHMTKHVYETILAHLRAYSTDSVHLFDELNDIDAQLAKGISQTKTCWDASSGTFTIPSDLTWVNYLSAYSATKDLNLSQTDRTFVNTMMAEYGFDVTTAKQLLTVKKGIDKKFSNLSQKERDYIFLRVVGAANYDGFQWDETAGYLTPYFYIEVPSSPITDEKAKVVKPLLSIYRDLGLSEQEAKQLNYNLRLQHNMAGGGVSAQEMKSDTPKNYESAKNCYKSIYGTAEGFDEFWDSHLKSYSNNGAGHADFTHQSITMATHLNPTNIQLSDVYGGREHVKDLAGWEGDTTFNANDMKPSIGEDDYKADLDSVNIIGRMEKGQTYSQASASYYRDVNKDSTTREKEFVKNKDWDKVKKTIYDSLVPEEAQKVLGEDGTRDYISESFEDVSKFLNRIESATGK
ncbi:MAG: LXG domain-containing protein [Streptococcus sp.]|uniref:T7SS effector LXG polymorphic toxin n=1 Tax=Streptococcus sp. TaxID=1306 RepID=UPI002586863D|nr:T7SS effector LXG polymorphic toxin [Streptococcus sp.]MCR5493441.1 LXG domain-containing protein [Streptococcus sp.]